MPAPSVRAALLRLASQLVQPSADNSTAQLTVIIKSAGSRLVLTATAAELAEFAAPHLSPMEEAILEALADGPMEGPELATRSGYENSGQFRKCLARLAGLGRITNQRGVGYLLQQPGMDS